MLVFLLGELFALPGGEILPEWMPELRERGDVVRQLARELGATFVSYQTWFDIALKKYSVAELVPDGVHPSPLGHELMTQVWLEATQL